MKVFKHFGVPTTTRYENEIYLKDEKLFVTDPESDPFRIEWLRFEPDSPTPDILKSTPHIAFEITDLEKEMKGYEVLIEPFETPDGYRNGFILYEGTPVELIQPPVGTDVR